MTQENAQQKLDVNSMEAAPRRDRRLARLCHPLIAEMLVGTFFLASLLAEIRILSASNPTWYNPLAHSLIQATGMLMAGCIVYCLWVEYCVSARRSTILAASAFAVLAFGMLIHGLVSVVASAISPGFRGTDAGTYYVCRLLAAVMLIFAAKNKATDSKQNYRKHGTRTLLSALAAAVLIALVMPAFPKAWAHFEPVFRSGLLHRFVLQSLFAPALRIISFVGFVSALAAYVQANIEEKDPLSNGIAGCLLLFVVSNATLLVSSASHDLAWWLSPGLTVTGLAVLLLTLGGEFASSYSDAHTRIEQLEAVHAITSQLNHTLDLRVVVLAFITDTATMLSARFASIMLADDAGETLTTACTYGLPDSPLSTSRPQGVCGSGRPGFYCGHTAKAFRGKRVCVVDDVYTDVEFIPWQVLAKYDGQAISVPLIYHEVVLGVLNLFFEKHVPLTDERIKLFQTLGSSVAVAIANAQLYDRTLQLEAQELNMGPIDLKHAS